LPDRIAADRQDDEAGKGKGEAGAGGGLWNASHG
jgi:hypothetical protein